MLKKIIKLFFKIFLWFILSFIALDLLVVTLLFVPPVQQFTVLKVSKLLTNLTGGEITVDKIYLTPFLKLKAENFAIKDHHLNNMIFATKLKGKINLSKTSRGQVCLSFAELDAGEVIIRKYAKEENVNIAIWAKGLKKEEKKEKKFKLLFNKIILNDVRVAIMIDDKRQYKDDNTIDYAFFELQHIRLNVNDFLVQGPDISCKINSLSYTQHTGFEMNEFNGNFRIYRQGLTLDSLHFKTPNSIFNGNFAFRYNDFSDYSDFVNKINFDTKVRSASLSMQDVIYFAPAIEGMDNQFIFSGYVGGTVNHLQTKDFYVKYKQQTYFAGNFAIENVTKFENSSFNFSIQDAYINFAELAQFKLPKGKTIPLPEEITKKLTYSGIHGNYKGSFTKFNIDLTAQTNLGTVTADLKTTNHGKTLSYSGNISCSHLELGKLFSQQQILNKINFSSAIEGEANNTKNMRDLIASLAVKIRGRISSVDVFGYPLKEVGFRGNYAQKKMNLALRSRDSLASLIVHGNVDLAKELPVINASLTKVDIKLDELFAFYPYPVDSATKGYESLIYKVQQNPNLAFQMDSLTVSISGTTFETVNGYVGIDNAKLTNGVKNSRLDWFRLNAVNRPNLPRQFQIHSNAFNVSFKTNYNWKDLKAAVTNAVYCYLPQMFDKNDSSVVLQEIKTTNPIQFIDLDVQFLYNRPFFELIFPKLELARNSSAYIYLGKTRDKDLFKCSFPQVGYTGIGKVNNLKIEGETNIEEWLSLQLQCDSLNLTPKKRDFTFSDINIQTHSNRKEVQFMTSWHNPAFISTKEKNYLHGLLVGSEPPDYFLKITDSKLFIRESLWQFSGEYNKVYFGKENIRFDQCVLNSNIGKISINGEISKNESNKECNIGFEKVDISLLNNLTAKSRMSFGGEMSLIATITSNMEQFSMEGKTIVKKFVFNNEFFGDLFLDTQILEKGGPHFTGGILSNNDQFKVDLSKFSYSDYLSLPNRLIELNGKWMEKEKELRVHADMDTLRLGFLSPFLATFSNVVSGDASGFLDFVLSKDSMYFDGKVTIKKAHLGIAPLNTIYNIYNQEILFNKEGIIFDKVVLNDKLNNTATLSGYVHHSKFKEFKIDLNISTSKILAMNTIRKIDDSFFGDGFVAGDVSIKGDTKLLNFTSHNIKTLSGSTITFPLSSASTVSSSQGIYFVQSSTNKEVSTKIKEIPTELNFDFIFDINKDADVVLELDPIDGLLQCKTAGKLRLKYNTLADLLDLDGTLSIVSGKFNMTLRNFFPRDFTIVEGGTISFSGPLTSAQLNVSALYQKATSLTSLSKTLGIGRTDVSAYLGLSGNLMNPNPSFTFAFPKLTSTDVEKVMSVLDTANQQSGIRQFFSFVFLNTFITDESLPEAMKQSVGTGIDVAAGIFNSLLSDQLGNMNIGMNYIRESFYQEYSLNTEMKFYNDRLVLRTNLGYSENSISQSNNNFVGKLELGLKLNDEGTWQMTFSLYNENSDINNNPDSYNSQKPQQGGGIGFVYRQAFNNKKDFLESWKQKRKVKKEKKQNLETSNL